MTNRELMRRGDRRDEATEHVAGVGSDAVGSAATATEESSLGEGTGAM
jgi:hypothetical protein